MGLAKTVHVYWSKDHWIKLSFVLYLLTVLYSTNEVFPFIIFCFHPNTEPFETSEVQYIVNFRHVSRNSKRIYQTVKKNFVSEKERKDDFLRNTFCGSLPPRIFLKTQPLFSPTDKLVLQQGVSEMFAVSEPEETLVWYIYSTRQARKTIF